MRTIRYQETGNWSLDASAMFNHVMNSKQSASSGALAAALFALAQSHDIELVSRTDIKVSSDRNLVGSEATVAASLFDARVPRHEIIAIVALTCPDAPAFAVGKAP